MLLYHTSSLQYQANLFLVCIVLHSSFPAGAILAHSACSSAALVFAEALELTKRLHHLYMGFSCVSWLLDMSSM